MKRNLFILVALFAIICLLAPVNSSAQFSDFLKKLKDNFIGNNTESLSEGKIVNGLKEALKIGSENAIVLVSKKGGYSDNPEIRIGLPDSIKKIESIIRGAGFGYYIDSFKMSMNRAAEKAAPEAKTIFMNALKKMTFTDAKRILNGRDNEATLYFREKCYSQLMETFMPLVHSSMSEVGVTRRYQDIDSKIKNIPFIGAMPVNFDLDKYVTENALNGIFLMLGKEEKKIRENPSARITELLKEVFGKK